MLENMGLVMLMEEDGVKIMGLLDNPPESLKEVKNIQGMKISKIQGKPVENEGTSEPETPGQGVEAGGEEFDSDHQESVLLPEATNGSAQRPLAAPGEASEPQVESAKTLPWLPLLVADKNGRAEIDFRLPRSETAFQVLVDAHAQGGRMGSVSCRVAHPTASGSEAETE